MDAPPSLVQAVFSSAGDSIVLLMSHDTNQPGTADCSTVLVSAGGLGAARTCQWTSARELTVFFGAAASVLPGDIIGILGGILVRAAPLNSPAAAQQSVAVRPPFPSVVPAIAIVAPAELGACDDLTLDASGSDGSGGRDWTQVSWSVFSRNPTAGASVAAINARLTAVTSLTVTIPRTILDDDATYHFTASLSNFFGSSGEGTADVMTSGLNLPTLSVQGGTTRTVDRLTAASISARATARGCDPTVPVPLTYSFDFVSGPTTVSLASVDSRTVSIAAGDLFNDATPYVVRVTAQVTGNSALTVSIPVTITVRDEAVSVIIAGGNRLVSPESALTLDASASSDPNNDALAVGGASRDSAKTYLWTCLASAGDCSSLATLLTGPSGTIPAAQLQAFAGSTLTFTVRFTSGARFATTSVDIQVAAVPVPAVGIAAPPGGRAIVQNGATVYKVNPSSRTTLTGTTDTPTGSPSWSLLQSDGSFSATAAAALFSTPANQLTVAITANRLAAGVTYRFHLTVQGTLASALGSATVTVLANAPPRLGVTTASRKNGTELTDMVTISAQRWVDDAADFPLQFQFFVDSSGATPTAAQLAQRQVGSPIASGMASSASFLMPASSHPGGQVTIVVYVADNAGSSTSSVTSVVSLKAVAEGASAADVQNFVDDAASFVSASLGDGDTKGALSVVSSLGSVMNSAAEGDDAAAPDTAVLLRRAALRESLVNTVSSALGSSTSAASESSMQAALGAMASLTGEPKEVSASMVSAVFGILNRVLGIASTNSRRLQATSVLPLSVATAQSSIDVLRNLLDSAPDSTGAGRALQARSNQADEVLSKLLVIHARVTVGSLPNEAPIALTTGLEELTGAAACVPTAGNTIAMQSQVLQCSTGITQLGINAVGTTVSTVETCNSGEAAFFGAGGAAAVPATVRSPSVSITADASNAICAAEVAVQLAAFTRPLAAAASAAGAIDPAYLGLSAAAGLHLTPSAAIFAGPTVHIEATAAGSQVQLVDGASVQVVLPLTANPAVPASAVLVLPGNSSTSTGRRAALVFQRAADAAGNYSVQCPIEASAYINGAATLAASCPAGDHSVTCTADEAGGTKSGACPVDAFTAACVRYSSASSAWVASSCTVTDISNDYLTCECSSTGAFAPSFATVTRGATTSFQAAPSNEPPAGTGGVLEESSPLGSAGSIVAVVVVAVIVVAFLGFIAYKKVQMDRIARERANRSKLYVPRAGARAVQVDTSDGAAAAQADAASKEALGQYRAAKNPS